MWCPPTRVTPKPRYQNTVVCERCHAEYNPKTNWRLGYYLPNTAIEFVGLYTVPAGHCPMCKTKAKLEKTDGTESKQQT